MKLLLENGAHVEYRRRRAKKTTLHVAITRGRSLDVILQLVNKMKTWDSWDSEKQLSRLSEKHFSRQSSKDKQLLKEITRKVGEMS